MVAFSLIAAARSGGSEGSGESTTTLAPAESGDDRVISDDELDTAAAVSGVWVPSSLALVDFVAVELAEDGASVHA
jgi:hypothetical protein